MLNFQACTTILNACRSVHFHYQKHFIYILYTYYGKECTKMSQQPGTGAYCSTNKQYVEALQKWKKLTWWWVGVKIATIGTGDNVFIVHGTEVIDCWEWVSETVMSLLHETLNWYAHSQMEIMFFCLYTRSTYAFRGQIELCCFLQFSRSLTILLVNYLDFIPDDEICHFLRSDIIHSTNAFRHNILYYLISPNLCCCAWNIKSTPFLLEWFLSKYFINTLWKSICFLTNP